MSLNKVQIIGNLGRDPEVRYTQDNKPIANLNVATTEKYKGRDGEMKENTEWHRVVLFGQPAEIAEKYLRKGSKVYVEGKLQTRSWTDKDGNEKYTTEIVVGMGGSMQMLDRSASNDNTQEQRPAAVSEDAPFDDDQSIPF